MPSVVVPCQPMPHWRAWGRWGPTECEDDWGRGPFSKGPDYWNSVHKSGVNIRKSKGAFAKVSRARAPFHRGSACVCGPRMRTRATCACGPRPRGGLRWAHRLFFLSELVKWFSNYISVLIFGKSYKIMYVSKNCETNFVKFLKLCSIC